MTQWAQLLHFYQPPTQTHEVLRRIAEESYRPLLGVLREHREARVAVNMNGVLTEMLADHGLGDVLATLRELVERGQVEVVGSGRYHPILPLIPREERRRSIIENARVNGSLLGARAARGFFPPEMCFSPEITAHILETGHEWLALSGVACPLEWPLRSVYRVAAEGRGSLAVLFRDDVRSNRVAFRETNAAAFVADLAGLSADEDAYVFTALDAETFGHHIEGWEREFLGAAFEIAGRPGSGVTMTLPGDIPGLFPAGPAIEPWRSSWSTTTADLAESNPFPLWQAPGNAVHALQWEYTDHVLAVLTMARQHASGEGPGAEFTRIAEERVGPALHSCQFWWASKRPMWSVDMIHRGFALLTGTLLMAERAVASSGAPGDVKREAAWRLAAAGDVRTRLERILFLDPE